MKKRLSCLGLVAAVLPMFSTGCCYHPIARFRANHPCLSCGPETHPLLHPIQTRRALLGDSVGPIGGPMVGGPVVGGPVSGPMVPPCHGCGGSGVPVSYSGGPVDGIPVGAAGYPPIVISSQGSPSIGSPIPIVPGPMVAPGNLLPSPMPLPKY